MDGRTASMRLTPPVNILRLPSMSRPPFGVAVGTYPLREIVSRPFASHVLLLGLSHDVSAIRSTSFVAFFLKFHPVLYFILLP